MLKIHTEELCKGKYMSATLYEDIDEEGKQDGWSIIVRSVLGCDLSIHAYKPYLEKLQPLKDILLELCKKELPFSWCYESRNNQLMVFLEGEETYIIDSFGFTVNIHYTTNRNLIWMMEAEKKRKSEEARLRRLKEVKEGKSRIIYAAFQLNQHYTIRIASPDPDNFDNSEDYIKEAYSMAYRKLIALEPEFQRVFFSKCYLSFGNHYQTCLGYYDGVNPIKPDARIKDYDKLKEELLNKEEQ